MSSFAVAMTEVLDWEGHYTDDPDDPGGETKWGISARQYPHLVIKELKVEQAVEIYRRDYWEKYGLGLIEDGLIAKKVFSVGVTMGMHKAVRFLQRACNELGANLYHDGYIGPQTAEWINTYRHHLALMALFKFYCAGYYRDLGKKKYIAGWLSRLEA